jgi:carboxylesterase
MTIKDLSIFHRGNRTGVLLIHGLGGTPAEMKTVARRVSEAGNTVMCCQLAGHCGSEKDLAATSWRDWYASAEAALHQLDACCDKIVVGGLSMGGILAAKLAAAEPERVQGLVILAPTLWYDGWSIPWYSFMLKVLRFLIDTPLGDRWRFVERHPYGIKDERVRKIILQAMNSGDSSLAGVLRTPPQALRELWRLVDALKPELSSIRQKTLLVQAREDDVASMSNAQYLQRKLGGIVETLILDDSYHLITMDRQRSIVTDRVVSFVQSISASRTLDREPEKAVAFHAA